jgi:Na+-translocating ferredoxin:NAD+ oxidoreductase RnfD subunit
MAVVTTPSRRSRRRRKTGPLVRFLKTPKGIVLVVLLALIGVAERQAGPRALPELIGAAAAAVALDMALVWRRQGTVPFPAGALISGLIVGGIVAPTSPWYVPPATAILAILSKHLIRTRWSNVFNPAALALVVSFFLFKSEQSWWGALPYVSPLWVPLLVGLGLYVASRVNKLPLVITFLGATLGVFTLASFAGDAAAVAEIYRPPDIDALLFFATLMLTDPPTSPARPEHQVWYALLVAAASCFAFLHFGALWFLTGGLLAGNAFESLRRVAHRRSVEARRLRQAPRELTGRVTG